MPSEPTQYDIEDAVEMIFRNIELSPLFDRNSQKQKSIVFCF